MIKCRECGQWFCEEHIEPLADDAADGTADGTVEGTADGTAEGSVGERLADIPTVKLVDTGLRGLTYYLGYCQACRVRRDQSAGRRPVDSSWLR